MRRLMIMNTSKPPIHLIQLLRKTPPSPVSLATSLQNRRLQSSEDYRICPFSILVLAKIITLSIPSTMSQCIYDSIEEFLVAVRYVDKKDGSDYKLFEDAHDFEVVWGDLYFGFLGKKLRHEEDFPSQMQLDQALQIIRDVKRESRNAGHISVREGIYMISEFIENKAYASIKDLYLYMEQLFVDMIRELLVQLADIMLKEIVKSSCEDLEDKVKEALKVVCKFEQLRDLDALSFLVGTTITTTNSETDYYVSTASDANIQGIPDTQNPISMLVQGTSSNCGSKLGVLVEGDQESNVVSDKIIQIG
ncbi:hypothetical protein Syun_006221 [Stephania yunnanensis]|uniref:Uncharacterized protein n=1 Tax=Stephania yunnanensis TaxID=152371 RepID=A0AAP0PYC6_9MAGN